MKVIFMGTPDFAVPCLERIVSQGCEVMAVFTQPDRPKGRGNKVSPPPVKECALRLNLPVYQPVKLKDGVVHQQIKQMNPDLIITVAYGRLLPVDILDLPRLGCINVHASLLPKLRGAAPIQRAILNGDSITGITVMYMAEGMDEGDIILARALEIAQDETSGELFARLSQLGADTLAEALPMIKNGCAPRVKQNHADATYAAMIDKSMAAIDFTKPAEEIQCLIRGLNPSPFAYTIYSSGRLKIHKANVIYGLSGKPGEVLDSKKLIIACGKDAIELAVVQPEGKKPMENVAFANSGKIKQGEILTSA